MGLGLGEEAGPSAALRDDNKEVDSLDFPASLDWIVRQGTEWAVKRMGRDSALVPAAALDSAQAREFYGARQRARKRVMPSVRILATTSAMKGCQLCMAA
jgi:hypothetical protein